MSYRRFSDQSGERWEIRERGGGDWEFRPIHGNPAAVHHGTAPHWQTDPYELSDQELQAVLADAKPVGGRASPGSFRDDAGKAGGGLFSDYEPPKKPKSPFLDDQD